MCQTPCYYSFILFSLTAYNPQAPTEEDIKNGQALGAKFAAYAPNFTGCKLRELARHQLRSVERMEIRSREIVQVMSYSSTTM